MRRLLILMILTAVAVSATARADEVDDILRTKVKNRDKIRKFSAEFTVETVQPRMLRAPKTIRMKFKLAQEKIPPAERKAAHQPWRIVAEVTEPQPVKLRIEGEQAWFFSHQGEWVEMTLTPEIREQFEGMSERFMGADPTAQRQNFEIKILRHNNPILGPRTRTVEYTPKGKYKLFNRLEEDVDSDGLPLETRTFDEKGNRSVTIKVKKHHKVHGVPFVDEMDSLSQSTVGDVRSHTVCANLLVESE